MSHEDIDVQGEIEHTAASLVSDWPVAAGATPTGAVSHLRPAQNLFPAPSSFAFTPATGLPQNLNLTEQQEQALRENAISAFSGQGHHYRTGPSPYVPSQSVLNNPTFLPSPSDPSLPQASTGFANLDPFSESVLQGVRSQWPTVDQAWRSSARSNNVPPAFVVGNPVPTDLTRRHDARSFFDGFLRESLEQQQQEQQAPAGPPPQANGVLLTPTHPSSSSTMFSSSPNVPPSPTRQSSASTPHMPFSFARTADSYQDTRRATKSFSGASSPRPTNHPFGHPTPSSTNTSHQSLGFSSGEKRKSIVDLREGHSAKKRSVQSLGRTFAKNPNQGGSSITRQDFWIEPPLKTPGGLQRPSSSGLSQATLSNSRVSNPLGLPPSKKVKRLTAMDVDHNGPTPSETDEDEDGQYDEWDDDDQPLASSSHISRRTPKVIKKKPEQPPIEKLQDFLDDVFEAEDAMVDDTSHAYAEASQSDRQETREAVGSSMFMPSSKPSTDSSGQAVILKTECIKKATKLTEDAAKSQKGKSGTVSELIEVSALQRLLKILERTVLEGQDVEVIPNAVVLAKRSGLPTENVPEKKTNGKRGKKGSGGKTKSPSTERNKKRSVEPTTDDDEDGDGAASNGRKSAVEDDDDEMWDEEKQDKLEDDLDLVLNAMMAIECSLTVMTRAELPRQALSEDLISACLKTLSYVLSEIVYPFVETSGTQCHPSLKKPLEEEASRNLLSKVFNHACDCVSLVERLTKYQDLSETLVIQASFISIGPFFVESPVPTSKGKAKEPFGSSTIKALRLSSLALIRTIYAKHEEQRQWILEEILNSLIKLPDPRKGKGQFRLRNGQAIHTISALLLHLVQTCTMDVMYNANKMFSGNNDAEEEEKPTPVLVSTKFLQPAIESINKAARAIAGYLINKAGAKGSSSANSTETEYRAVLDNFIGDLLIVLNLPEWPAADCLVNIFCNFMMAALEDTRSTSEVNNAKSLSLDHLGTIGARLKQKSFLPDESGRLRSLTEIVSQRSSKDLTRLLRAQREVLEYLASDSKDGSTDTTAATFLSIHWRQELAHAWKISSSILEKFSPEDKTSGLLEYREALSLNGLLQQEFIGYWSGNKTTKQFDTGQHDRVQNLMDELFRIGPVQGINGALLSRILGASEHPIINTRAKALRALGQIVAVSPDLFEDAEVRSVIEHRFSDGAVSVREAAVELVGKHVVQNSKLAPEYVPKITERVADTGLAVRKKAIKLLKTLYPYVAAQGLKTEIARRLLCRVADEDDGVKDLAMDAIEDLWFKVPSTPSSRVTNRMESLDLDDNASNVSRNSHTDASSKAGIVMAVASSAPLEDALKYILAKHAEKGAQIVFNCIQSINETLIDALVDPQEADQVDLVNCVKTIYILTAANPSMISPSRAETLIPHLKSASTREELVTCEYLLKTFRLCVAAMPRTASKFAQDLQATLLGMINKPNASGGSGVLQELVACFCAVIKYQTRDFQRLITVFSVCQSRVRNDLKNLKNATQNTNFRALIMVTCLTALFCEYSDLDEVRNQEPSTVPAINKISQGSISDHIYKTLYDVYIQSKGTPLQPIALQCLGFIFRSHPGLMTLDKSFELMDEIFKGNQQDMCARVFKIFQESLAAQAGRAASLNEKTTTGKVDIKVLIGDISDKGFADAGVASAIIQRYQDRIFTAALSQIPNIQKPALDVLGYAVKQGLCHPISCLSTLVALETGEDLSVASRAFSLHHHLHTKHTSLVSTRYIESSRSSFDYQRQLAKAKGSSGPVIGYRGDGPTALLSRWWSLLRDKRATRLEFLTTIVKVFSVDPGPDPSCSWEQVTFSLYIASNLSALDYKTTEDVLAVLSWLTRHLGSVAWTLVHLFKEEEQSSQSDPTAIDPDESTQSTDTPSQQIVPSEALCRHSIIVMLVLQLKDYLKSLYGISEQVITKYQPGKKSHDRPATRRGDIEFFDCNLPSLSTNEELIAQREEYCSQIERDGTIAEPDSMDL